RTIIWDVRNLHAPAVIGMYFGPTTATDHNLYIARGYAFESNYRAGLRVLDLANVAAGGLSQVAFFDVFPGSDEAGYAGTWTNSPFFAGGTVVLSGIESGLFVLRPNLPAVQPTATPPDTPTATVTRPATASRTPSATPTVTPIPVIVLDAIPSP